MYGPKEEDEFEMCMTEKMNFTFHVRWPCSYLLIYCDYNKMTEFIFGIHIVKELSLRHCSRGRHMHVMSPSLGRPRLAEGGERAASGRMPSLQGSLLSHRPVPVTEPTLLIAQARTEVMPEIGKVMGGTEYACDTCRNQNRSRGRHLLVPIRETWSKLYTNPNITKWRFYLCIST